MAQDHRFLPSEFSGIRQAMTKTGSPTHSEEISATTGTQTSKQSSFESAPQLSDLCDAILSKETQRKENLPNDPQRLKMAVDPTKRIGLQSNNQVYHGLNFSDDKSKLETPRADSRTPSPIFSNPYLSSFGGTNDAVKHTTSGYDFPGIPAAPAPNHATFGHQWSHQPFMLVNTAPAFPPQSQYGFPTEHRNVSGATRNIGAAQSMDECEVYDVDCNVSYTERHPTNCHHKVRSMHSNNHEAFPKAGQMFGGIPNGHYSFPSQVPDPRYHPGHGVDAAMRQPTQLEQAHPPMVVQTGYGPALLLPPGPVPTQVPMPAHPNNAAVNPFFANPSTLQARPNPRAGSSTNKTAPTAATLNFSTVSAEPPVSSTRFQRWSAEEDKILTKATQTEGGPPYNWNRIAAKYFPNTRTGPQCKARWKKALKPGLKRGNWEPEEDRVILELNQQGLKWADIAQRLPGRVADHVRQRFMNSLDPNKKRTPWTEEENKILYDEQKRIGNKWSEISKLLPGRSENDIKNRWHNAKMAQRRKMRRIAKETTRKGTVERAQMHTNAALADLADDDYMATGLNMALPNTNDFLMSGLQDDEDESHCSEMHE